MAEELETDVVLVGAGLIGCAAAWALVRAGRRVVVVDRGAPGGESSSAAAGILGAQVESHGPGPLLELLVAGRARWRPFLDALGAATGRALPSPAPGVLKLALDREEAEALEARRRWQQTAGLRVEQLDAAGVEAIEPGLAGVVAALLFPDDAQLDPRPVVAALVEAARGGGARFVRAEARGLAKEGGGWTLALGDGGVVRAGEAVVAGGSWSSELAGAELPAGAVIPVRGQLVAFDAAPPRHTAFGGGGYLFPRDGHLVVGSTEERVGWDKSVTSEGEALLVARAARLAPRTAGARVLGAWSGLRPGSADGLPWIGRSASGAVVASGHYRNGILLAPLTAELVVALVTGGAAPVDATPFSPMRAARALHGDGA